jgi:hypothetical protein
MASESSGNGGPSGAVGESSLHPEIPSAKEMAIKASSLRANRFGFRGRIA